MVRATKPAAFALELFGVQTTLLAISVPRPYCKLGQLTQPRIQAIGHARIGRL